MTKIGYIRATKKNQNLHFQKYTLEKFGCTTVLVEDHEFLNERRVLKKILRVIRPGDQLVMTELDVLSVKIDVVLKIIKYIYQRKASLIALNMQSMTNNNGEIARLSNAAVVEFHHYFSKVENETVSLKRKNNSTSNQINNMAGRKPKFKRDDPLLQEAFHAYQNGELNEMEIERNLGINRQTFRRYRKKYGIERNGNKKNNGE